MNASSDKCRSVARAHHAPLDRRFEVVLHFSGKCVNRPSDRRSIWWKPILRAGIVRIQRAQFQDLSPVTLALPFVSGQLSRRSRSELADLRLELAKSTNYVGSNHLDFILNTKSTSSCWPSTTVISWLRVP